MRRGVAVEALVAVGTGLAALAAGALALVLGGDSWAAATMSIGTASFGGAALSLAMGWKWLWSARRCALSLAPLPVCEEEWNDGRRAAASTADAALLEGAGPHSAVAPVVIALVAVGLAVWVAQISGGRPAEPPPASEQGSTATTEPSAERAPAAR